MAKIDTSAFHDEAATLIAKYAAEVNAKLDADISRSAKRALLDSVAVSLGALAHPASLMARRYAGLFPMEGPHACVVFGSTKKSSPDIAALANGVLLRCYDYNDFFVGGLNSGHPSDMMCGLLAAAEYVGASGAELLSAIAVGYEVTAACFDALTTYPGGWDYTNLTSIGACCAIARVMKLNATQTQEALAMTVIPHFASDEIESGDLNKRGDLTMWKRFNGSDAVRNALQACLLATVGVEGAVRPFTGKYGFIAKMQMKDDPLPLLRERLQLSIKPKRVAETYMKRWPIGSVAQSAIQAAIEARTAIGGDISKIKAVRIYAEEGAYDHLVAIRLDPYNPISRETADHSLPYAVATAILDGFVRTDSFDLERVLDPTRAAFLRDKVKAFPAPELGTIKGGKLKRAQDGYLSRVEIELNDGTVVHGAAKPFPGHPKNPFSDDELRAKIVENAEPIMGKAALEKLVKYLLAIETAANVKDLTALMAFECKDQAVAAA